jgi:Holliday junction DNA helicase RuvA
LHPADRAFFTKFVKVKGIGMRKALKALAEPMARTAAAIEGGDTAMLGRLPGIGKRAAEQIVAELRGKMKAFATGEAADGEPASVDWTRDQRDALEILVGALRERREDAERWLARAGMLAAEPASAEEWVKAAYRVRSGSEG